MYGTTVYSTSLPSQHQHREHQPHAHLGDRLRHVVKRVDLVVVEDYSPPLLLVQLLLVVHLRPNATAREGKGVKARFKTPRKKPSRFI